ncbi:hypothetical protein [Nocardia sp. NPDC020380]|uniref:hypothetical protein n=1 Tax=Nocardia sp. NPDC020380 TaxID=3364309 RepID=UPI0037965F6D
MANPNEPEVNPRIQGDLTLPGGPDPDPEMPIDEDLAMPIGALDTPMGALDSDPDADAR